MGSRRHDFRCRMIFVQVFIKVRTSYCKGRVNTLCKEDHPRFSCAKLNSFLFWTWLRLTFLSTFNGLQGAFSYVNVFWCPFATFAHAYHLQQTFRSFYVCTYVQSVYIYIYTYNCISIYVHISVYHMYIYNMHTCNEASWGEWAFQSPSIVNPGEDLSVNIYQGSWRARWVYNYKLHAHVRK